MRQPWEPALVYDVRGLARARSDGEAAALAREHWKTQFRPGVRPWPTALPCRVHPWPAAEPTRGWTASSPHNRPLRCSASRIASAASVSVGFAAGDVGKTDRSHTY